MKVRFWGTRGSIPVPGDSALTYGGNTSCVELQSDNGALIILDCGSGLRLLGQSLLAAGDEPLTAAILLSHLHWDHIQGLPFFAPAYLPGNGFSVYGPRPAGGGLMDALAGQMAYPHFPVPMQTLLQAKLSFHELAEETFSLHDVTVATHYLNHTSVDLGYRLTCGGASVAYITDHEPFAMGCPQAEGASMGTHRCPRCASQEQALIDFVRGVDLLIQDAQYTPAEYAQRVGWGHSPIDYCIDVALRAGVRQLALFHHDPLHTDAMVESLVRESRERVRVHGGGLHVFGAAEGGEVVCGREPHGYGTVWTRDLGKSA